MPDYKAAFFIVPARILNLPGIKFSYIRIYEAMFQFWNHKKPCFLSNAKIMEMANIESEGTIRKAFVYFEQNGELKRTIRQGKRYLTSPEMHIEFDESETIEPSQTVPTGTPDRSHRNALTVPTGTHKNKNLNNKNLNIKDCSSDDERFTDFWKAYPRKQKRKDALKAWEKINPALTDQIINNIRDRLSKDVQWQDKQYIPLPASYLRGECWNDEIIIAQPKQPQVKSSEPRSTVQWFKPEEPQRPTMRDFTTERLAREELERQSQEVNNGNNQKANQFGC